VARPRPTPRLRERRLAGSRAEILDATRVVLAGHGPSRLTLELVARELGISKQALYHYFRSRDALLFELVVEEVMTAAREVHGACAAAGDAGDALAALIRTYVGYFLPRLELFRLTTMQTAPADIEVTATDIERVRPMNDLMYGEIERRLVAEQGGKRRDRKAARRLAFTAHMAAIGFLTVRAITEAAGDPLLHSDQDVIDELCRTFRAAAERRTS